MDEKQMLEALVPAMYCMHGCVEYYVIDFIHRANERLAEAGCEYRFVIDRDHKVAVMKAADIATLPAGERYLFGEDERKRGM